MERREWASEVSQRLVVSGEAGNTNIEAVEAVSVHEARTTSPTGERGLSGDFRITWAGIIVDLQMSVFNCWGVNIVSSKVFERVLERVLGN